MDAKRDADIDPAPLVGKRIAIIGYGNQGRAQALNLHDGGFDVVVGLRDGSPSRKMVERDGLVVLSLADAADGADLVMLLAPDETMGALYRTIEPELRAGAALGFGCISWKTSSHATFDGKSHASERASLTCEETTSTWDETSTASRCAMVCRNSMRIGSAGSRSMRLETGTCNALAMPRISPRLALAPLATC